VQQPGATFIRLRLVEFAQESLGSLVAQEHEALLELRALLERYKGEVMEEKTKVIVRSLLSISTMGVALYISIVGTEVPPWLTGIIGGQLIDWYYATKNL